MPQDTLQFYAWLRARLAKKKYVEIGPVPPLDVAFSKHGALNLPYVVAVTDTAHISDTPTEICQRVENWLQGMHGSNGAGCLIFVYHGAPAVTTIEEITKNRWLHHGRRSRSSHWKTLVI